MRKPTISKILSILLTAVIALAVVDWCVIGTP